MLSTRLSVRSLFILAAFMLAPDACTPDPNAPDGVLTPPQWVQTAGPQGSFVGAMLVSGSYLIAGTSGGVFRSTDNGASWVSSGLTGINVQALAGNGTHLFAGTFGGGVFVSTD